VGTFTFSAKNLFCQGNTAKRFEIRRLFGMYPQAGIAIDFAAPDAQNEAPS
jgi:hypothetical protein